MTTLEELVKAVREYQQAIKDYKEKSYGWIDVQRTEHELLVAAWELEA